MHGVLDNPGQYFKELLTPHRHNHAGYLQLSKHYIAWYKTGKEPEITRDGLFWFYRTHPRDATATKDDKPVTQFHGDVEDVIYLTTMLTAPAEVLVRTGGKSVTREMPAGISHTKVVFSTGKQHFELKRDDKTLAEADGAEIEAMPERYNFFPTSGYVYGQAEK